MKERRNRRERESEAHRVEILDAAEEIFAEKGFIGASVQEIAERADFSVGSLYYFFESKERLYDEVIGRRVDEVYEVTVTAAAGAGDPPTMIRKATEAMFAYIEEHRAVVHLFFRETVGFKMRMRGVLGESIFEKYDRYQALFLSVFKAGVDSGHFRDHDPQDLMLAYTGIVLSFLAQRLDADPEAGLLDLIPRMERVFYGRIGGAAERG